MITVYSTTHCSQCMMTKRRLTKRGLEFEEVNLEENPDQLNFVKNVLGYSQAPVVIVEEENQTRHWSGFRPDLIDQL